jgi:RHS repeat-associated protein
MAAVVVAALILLLSSLASGLPDWMLRPGTIGHAVSLRDGSHVYLDAVIVDKIRAKQTPAYLVVRECFSAEDRIIVLTPPSSRLRLGQLVDIEGTISTLSNGNRAIVEPTVLGYTDEDGNLLLHGPLIKGLLEPTPWEWMVDLTIHPEGKTPAPTSPSSPEPNTTPSRGPTYYANIGDVVGGVRTLANGDFLGLAEFECKPIVSTGYDQTCGNYFIMGEDAGQDTLKVYCQTEVSDTDRVNKVSGQLREENGTAVLCVNSGPGYNPQVYEGSIQLAAEGTIAYARTCSDGADVSLPGKVVTADRSDLSGDRLYVEEPDRSAGILVVYSGTEAAERDATVDVTGTINTLSSGERWIDAGSSGIGIVTPSEPVPTPLGMNNRALGGSDFNVLTLGVNVPDGYGLYNVGSLVKCWGRVTGVYSTENCFYIDDGSFSYTDDSTGHGPGIRVSWDWQNIGAENPEIVPPTQGWYITVLGISGVEVAPGNRRIRVLRLRRQADTYGLPDINPPIPGTASSPSHVTSSPINVTYSGAWDDISGLKEVELWYRKGPAGTWTYSGSYRTGASGSFSFAVTEEDIYYFDLVAEDNAGNRSAPASGYGDTKTVYGTGHACIVGEYLYPGGPLMSLTAYDENGAQARQVTTGYGREGEVLSETGDSEVVRATYDAAYRLKSIADGMNNITLYDYDAVGNLAKITYPDGQFVQFPDHDGVGNVLTRVDANGVTTTFDYDDPENFLTEISYPNPALNVNFSYDSYGRLATMTDPAGVVNYQNYDDLDQPTQVATSFTGGPSDQVVGYEFWPDGSLQALTTPAGSFAYAYDEVGRLASLTNPFGQTYSWTYYDNNWLESQTLNNGAGQLVASTSYQYNPRGFLTDLTNKTSGELLRSEFGGSSGMTFDSLGNLLSVTADIPGQSTYSGLTSYSYDSKDQLTCEDSARIGGYVDDFGYDAASNPITFRNATGRSFNENNQRSQAGFVYDGNGNPTTYRNSTALTFDPEDRMTAYGSALTGVGYRGDGLRAYKGPSQSRTYYLCAGGVPVCELTYDAQTVTVSATDTLGVTGLLSRRQAGTDYFYTFDPQGSVVQVLNSNGTVVATVAYDAYGSPLAGSPTNPTPYGYGGQAGYYTDPATGLILATNRYYDPVEGRWLTRDPIGYAGGMNLYGYCGGNPVNGADPLGLRSIEDEEWDQIWAYDRLRNPLNALAAGFTWAGNSRYNADLAQVGLRDYKSTQPLGIAAAKYGVTKTALMVLDVASVGATASLVEEGVGCQGQGSWPQVPRPWRPTTCSLSSSAVTSRRPG